MLSKEAILLHKQRNQLWCFYDYDKKIISSKNENSDNQPAVSIYKIPNIWFSNFSLTWLKQQGWLCCANIASEKEN